MLNFSNFEESTPSIEIENVINKILKQSNKNKYNYIIKDHTRRKPHKKNKENSDEYFKETESKYC